MTISKNYKLKILSCEKNLKKKPLIKNEIVGKKNNAGKNNQGKITISHKGSGNKKKYRKISFLRNSNSTGIVTSLEYDPFRTAFIASVYDILNSYYFYIIAPKHLDIGDIIKSGSDAEIKTGHSLSLAKIPVGTYVHNVSLKQNKGAQLSRSAGTATQLIERTSNYCRVILSSGKHTYLSPMCQATIGSVSNEFSFFKKINKAGCSRWLNKRPTIRGVAMNPVDHPHGGGEGKSSGGRSSVTPWGKPTKNSKTSNSRTKKLKY